MYPIFSSTALFNKLIASESMNNTTKINHFHSDNVNIAYIKEENCQILTTIAYRILKLMHSLLLLILGRSIPSFRLIL